MIASAVTLGTGGSGGREGPIAQIGAGFGSLWPTCCDCGPPNAASSWLPAWEPGSAPFSAHRWRGRSSRPKFSTAPRNLNPRSSFPREWPVSFPIASLALYGLEATVHHPRSDVYQSVAVGAIPAPGPVHGAAGHAVYAVLLRVQAAVRPAAHTPPFSAGHWCFSDGVGWRRLVPSGAALWR